MLKTNSKEVRAAVKAHIMDVFDPLEENKDKDFSTFLKVARHLKETCDHEVGHIRNEYERMSYWLCGMPSEINPELVCCKAKELVRQWLHQTKEEAEAYDDGEAFDKYIWLVSREIISCVR